ncbi:MAG: periplasmic heavy metal sensor [Nitrospinae bacterium]|nr:periplasmic heavy metal sensor [Nitrospinota bacterium]
MRRIVVALFLTGFALTAMDGWGRSAAWAEGGAATVKPMAGDRRKEPTAALFFSGRLGRIGLSKEQKEKIRAIFVAHEGALAGASARYIEKRRQMRTLIDDPGATEEAIAGVGEDIGQIEGELAIERNRVLKEVMSQLTPEQAAKFKKGRLAGQRQESGQPR